MSSIDFEVSKALLISPVNSFWRYLEPLQEFYCLADQVNIRSPRFVEMSNAQIGDVLTQMITELNRAKIEVNFDLTLYSEQFSYWAKRLTQGLSYELYGLAQYEVKIALKDLAHRAVALSWVIESQVGRNNWVRELEDLEQLVYEVYGAPELSQSSATKVYSHIVSLVEDCAEILEEGGSSSEELTPLKHSFVEAFEQEYGQKFSNLPQLATAV